MNENKLNDYMKRFEELQNNRQRLIDKFEKEAEDFKGSHQKINDELINNLKK